MAAPRTGYGQLVLLEKKDNYGIITLNRPEKRNAMNRAIQAELRAAIEDAREDCRVLIVTGNGPAFCSGVDLSEAQHLRESGAPPQRMYAHGSITWVETNEAIRKHPAVFIAAVNGYALGGGLTLVNNCDLAIASERAEFGMPEVGFGTFPAYAGPTTVRRVPPKQAAYMLFTAQRIDAQTAATWNIVNKVVPHDRLLEEAEALADHIAQFDPILLDYSKKALRDLELMPWPEALIYGNYMSTVVRRQTDAAAQGIERFLGGTPNPGQGTVEPDE